LHDEVLRLKHLVEDLRTLSLADTGELPLKCQAVDPQTLLEQTGLAYTPLAEQKGVTLHIQPASALPAIDVDADRIIQVLSNLVDNALRFTPAGGAISLAAQQQSTDYLQIMVRDTGTGIPPEHLPHVFGRFYRADQSRNRDDTYSSSGLGLAIAKSIVIAHGGTISAASQLDGGSVFTIALPLAQLV
jgi:two-component system sensor histidine kinase BaeS